MTTNTTSTWSKSYISKIGREIKRVINKSLRFLTYPLYCFVYRKAAKRENILFRELKATETIVQKALDNLEFAERMLEAKSATLPMNLIKSCEFLRETPKELLEEFKNRLVADTDELSHEVVNRFLARRQFIAEYGYALGVWTIFSIVHLRSTYPLDYAAQKHIQSMRKAQKCPYQFPTEFHVSWLEHMATDYGLNQFPPEIQKRVAGKDILDGGGFLGESAMIFTEYDPRKVYAFEPNPDIIPTLKSVLADNAAVLGERKNLIEVVPLALGQSKGKLTLYSYGGFDGSASLEFNDQGRKAHEVDVVSIDEFVKVHSLDVGLIKLDLEGAEYDTMMGAKETIIKQRPLLLISIYHSFKDFFEIKPLIESWGLDYKFEIRHHAPSAPEGEFVLMAY